MKCLVGSLWIAVTALHYLYGKYSGKYRRPLDVPKLALLYLARHRPDEVKRLVGIPLTVFATIPTILNSIGLLVLNRELLEDISVKYGVELSQIKRDLHRFYEVFLDCVFLYPPRHGFEYDLWGGQELEKFLRKREYSVTKQRLREIVQRLCELRGEKFLSEYSELAIAVKDLAVNIVVADDRKVEETLAGHGVKGVNLLSSKDFNKMLLDLAQRASTD